MTLSIFLTLTVLITVSSQQNLSPTLSMSAIGPRNLTRLEGERDVLIPCPVYGRALPSWVLNNTILYSISNLILEYPFIESVYNGLLITSVNRSLNQTTFQCVIPSTEDVQMIIGSSVGKLTVQSGIQYNGSNLFSQRQIVLDVHNIHFSDEAVTLAWMNIGSPSCMSQQFVIEVRNCDGSLYKSWITMNFSFTFNYTDLVDASATKSRYILINGYGPTDTLCTSLGYGVEIESSPTANRTTKELNVALGTNACIDIPQRNYTDQTLHVTWPYSSEPGSLNCDCSFPESALQSCSCINDTKYTLRNGKDSNLCFLNLTETENNTRVLFFFATSECEEKLHGFGTPLNYNRFVKSTLIIVRESPTKPSIWLSEDTTVIYFNSTFTMLPIVGYEITIQDKTKYDIFYHNNDPLIDHVFVGDVLQPRVCAPYIITVVAHNQYVSSSAQYKLNLQNTSNSSICDCIEKQRVNASVIANENANEVVLEITCNSSFVQNTNITVSLLNSSMEIHNATLICNKTLTTSPIKISELDRKKTYEYVIKWKDAHTEPCILVESNFTTSGIKSQELIGAITGPISFVIVIIIIAAIFIIAKIFLGNKKRRNKYKPLKDQNGNDRH